MTLLINSFFSLIKVTICLCYEYRTIKLKPQTEVSPIKQYVIPGLFWNGWVFWPSDELGRYPLIFDVNKIILKYISYLQSKEQSSLVIQSLVMSIDLHVIYQTRETVFHRDIQTPRRELKIRRAAEYF